MLVLGGGGYTLRNVPRVWTFETAVLLGTDIKDALPYNDYFEYYGPDYRLHMPVSNMENLNSKEYLEHIKVQLFDILSQVEPVPGVQIQAGASEAPPRSLPTEWRTRTEGLLATPVPLACTINNAACVKSVAHRTHAQFREHLLLPM